MGRIAYLPLGKNLSIPEIGYPVEYPLLTHARHLFALRGLNSKEDFYVHGELVCSW